MFYITGDTHGNFAGVIYFIKKLGLTSEDTIIILGDAGFNYYGGKKDNQIKELIKDTGVNIFCIHGNHERRPETIDTYKLVDFCGGKAYVEDAYPNIYFGKDGEIFDFNGLSTIVIGGAYSIDKHYRLMRGWHWFEDEQPSEEIKKYVEEQLEKNDWKIDVVLTHTCPESLEPTEWFLDFVDQSTVDKSTEKWLETIREKLTYKYWFCGHFHGEKITDQIRFFFENFDKYPNN